VGRLGLGSEPHVVGRLGSGPRVGARLSPGVFSVGGLSSRGVVSGGGYLRESHSELSSAEFVGTDTDSFRRSLPGDALHKRRGKMSACPSACLSQT